MNKAKINFFLFLVVFTLQGCLNTEGIDDGKLQDNKPIKENIYISTKGIDSETSGDKAQPYKSISYALEQYQNKAVIVNIEGGRYREYLNLEKGVELVNSYENNNSVILRGTVSLNGENKLDSLTLENSSVVVSKGKDNKIMSCNFLNNSTYAILVKSNASLSIEKSTIRDNSSTGIVAMEESTLYLSEMNISNNNIGVQIKDNAKITFSEPEYYVNYIRNNKQCNFLHSGKENLELYNVLWNKKPLDFIIEKRCTNGLDIVQTGKGIINYEGKIPKKGTISFSTNKKNEIINPAYKESILTKTPYFEYTNVNRDYLAISIFDKFPIIRNNSIQNHQNIVWYWQSNLDKNYPIGSIIPYGRGYIFPSVKKDNYSPFDFQKNPPPLKKNSIYYIIIWEWDSDANKVISSSDISYFIVDKDAE